jgi:hypothetical protein
LVRKCSPVSDEVEALEVLIKEVRNGVKGG